MNTSFVSVLAVLAAVGAAKTSFVTLTDAEIALLQQEVNEWKVEFGDEAMRQGALPPTSALESVDTTDEILRFLDSKLAIDAARRQNPHAHFALNAFALLTPAEFASFVQRSFNNDTIASTESLVLENEDPIPSQVDWTTDKCNGPVKSQGQCGSCWAFSTVGTAEFAHCVAKDELLDLSEQQVVSCAAMSGACVAGSPRRALEWLRDGVCVESDWVYTSGTTNQPGTCDTQCHKKPLDIGSSVLVHGEAAIVSALAKQTVVVVVESGNPVWQFYAGGVVTQCPGASSDHAVIAVGYTDEYIKIKNSWGAGWGEQGYMRLRRGGVGTGTCNVMQAGYFPQLTVSPKSPPTTTVAPPTTTSPPLPTATPEPTTAVPDTTVAIETPATTAPAATTSMPTVAIANTFEQCGGQGFTGPTSCGANDTCHYYNQWYSQCKPKA